MATRRPAAGPLLIRAHKAIKLRFAREHAHWTIEEWRNTFLRTSPVLLYIRKMKAKERRALFRMQHGFMGRLCISLMARTKLHIIAGGTLTAQRYVEDILEEYIYGRRSNLSKEIYTVMLKISEEMLF